MYEFPKPDNPESLQDYLDLIESIKKNITEEYPQVCHHIVPRCLGGSEETSNKLNISHQSHYELHHLLALAYPSVRGLVYAAYMMSRRGNIDSREYAELQSKFQDVQSKHMSMMNQTYTYVHKGDEELYIKRVEIPVYESLGYVIGMSEAHRKNIGNSHRGLIKSESTRKKIRESNLGKHKGKIWVNNGSVQCTIPPESLEEYIELGYVRGRLPFSESHINNLRRPKSQDHKDTISKNMIERWKDPAYIEKMKPILSKNAKSRYLNRGNNND